MTSRLLVVATALLLAGCPKNVPESSRPEPTPAGPPAPAASAPAPAPSPVQPPALKLPDFAAPTSYLARLSIDPSKETFEGELSIDVTFQRDSDLLWLNATGLKIASAELESAGARRPLEVVAGDDDFFALRGAFVQGAAKVHLRYSGSLDRERSRGLYSQEEPNGAGWYAYTFFEPIDARRVFPCFDEPSYKVPWTLEIRTPKGNLAFANSKRASETAEGEWTRFTFEPTPPMPSYLVAFGVGPFETVDLGPAGQKKVPTQLVFPRGRAAETRYAQQVTTQVVSALESFIGLPYPYDKLDVLVVPRFWGTMEHPGIVAMGQPLTLILPNEETVERKQRYANILIHELGHYWFGDLVTMAWWDDTWLNEAMTTWFDTRVTERFEPSWKWELQHQAMMRAEAMRTDALLSAQSLRAPVTTREEITGSFENTITYFKGSSVIAMLEGWVGPEKFRGVLRDYLKRFSWKNARTEDLLDEVGRGAGAEARAVFESFIGQPGVPLLTAKVTCEEGKPRLSLAQERYVPAGPAPRQEWVFPVCLRSDVSGGAETCTVMDAPQKETSLPWSKCPSWVLANAGGRGYYRVRLAPDDGEKLLLKAKLQEPERLAVASDFSALAVRGEIPPAKAFALAPALAKEPSPMMVRAAMQLMSTARYDQLSDSGRERLAGFTRRTFGERAAKVGWKPRPGETDEDLKLRQLLLGQMGDRGRDPSVTAEARKQLNAWLTDRKAVSEEMLETVLYLGTLDGDAALFDRLLAAGQTTENRREKEILISSLGGFRNPALNLRALELLTSGKVDFREASGILYGSLGRSETRDQAWAFLEKNFDAIGSKMRDDEITWLSSMVGTTCDEERLARAEKIFREKGGKYGLVMRALDNAVERAKQCIATAKKTVPEVEKFLQSQPVSGPKTR